MATKIVTKNSSTASAVPTASDLVQGELAVNVADKRLFTEDNLGAIVELGTNPSGNVTFQDNGKAIFGAGSDLQIYHTGGASKIVDAGVGVLEIQTNGAGINLTGNSGAEFMARFISDGASQLYYDGSAKLATAATGIDVTGTATMNGLTVSNLTNSVLKLESTGIGLGAGSVIGDIQFYGNDASVPGAGIKAGIKVETVAALGDDAQMKFTTSDGTTNNIDRMLIANNGDISFYEDTGTTPKFFWDASAESLGIGTSSPSARLDALVGSDERLLFTTLGSDPFIGAVNGANSSYKALQLNGSDLKLLTNGSERMRIDASGNVGIGTSSPSGKLEVNGGGTATSGGTLIVRQDGDTYADGIALTSSNATSHRLWKDSSGRLNIGPSNLPSAMVQDLSGNVGIGTSSPSQKLHVDSGEALIKSAYSATGTTNSKMYFASREGGNWRNSYVGNTGDALTFATGGTGTTHTNATERLRIDASGNVGIGTSSPSVNAKLDVQGGRAYFDSGSEFSIRLANSGTAGAFIGTSAANTLNFYNGVGAERMRIDASGNVGIGTSSPDTLMHLSANTGATLTLESTDTAITTNEVIGAIDFFSNDASGIGAASRGSISLIAQDAAGAGSMLFKTSNASTASAERMRIDSSGNLLVGTTDNTPYNNSGTGNSGSALHADGLFSAAREGNAVGIFNRLVSDGDIVEFRKDGLTKVGSIGSYSSSYLTVGNNTSGLAFLDAGSPHSIRPHNVSTNVSSDDLLDLGATGARFNDIYATNGTIQTSDRNEKQDIAELSEAEQRVAVAAKGLLRKFRWKDSVAEKGDDARIHFGIIAQDLQAAFEAEGLDAGDYAMFISTTWTDEETNEEKTRMGVRYSELLAFIISAI